MGVYSYFRFQFPTVWNFVQSYFSNILALS